MEGSVAGLGGGQSGADAGQGEAQQQQGQQAQQQGLGFDPAQLMGTLGEVQSGQEALRELLQQQQAGGGEDEAAQHELDLSFLDPMAGLDPTQMADQLRQVITGEAERIANSQLEQLREKEINPLVQRLNEADRVQMVRDLAEEFPEIAEQETAQQVVGLSTQLVAANGWPQELAGDPRMWRLAFLAGRAMDAHNEEGQRGDDPGAALLEGGRGPGPGGAGQVDPGDLIVNGGGRRGAGALPFG